MVLDNKSKSRVNTINGPWTNLKYFFIVLVITIIRSENNKVDQSNLNMFIIHQTYIITI